MKQTAMQDLREDLIESIVSGTEALQEIEDTYIRDICVIMLKKVMSNVVKRIDEELLEMEKQQQGYSEEEVLELIQKALTHQDDGETGNLVTAQGKIRTANLYSWFNRFKNR